VSSKNDIPSNHEASASPEVLQLYRENGRLRKVLRHVLDSVPLAVKSQCPTCGEAEKLANGSAVETACRIDDKDIRMFLGWLSVELPELHAIETSRLGRAWEKWLELMHAQETRASDEDQRGKAIDPPPVRSWDPDVI
jgi:hypothetical protein